MPVLIDHLDVRRARLQTAHAPHTWLRLMQPKHTERVVVGCTQQGLDGVDLCRLQIGRLRWQA
jgi:hypothetical protein